MADVKFDDFDSFYQPKKGEEVQKPNSPSGGVRFDDFDSFYQPKPPEAPAQAGGTLQAIGTKVGDVVRNVSDGLSFGLGTRLERMFEGKEVSDARKAETDERTPWLGLAGRIAGEIAPAILMSNSIGKLVPAAGRATKAAAALNAGMTGAAMSAGNDIIGEGQMPDPIKAGTAALIGAPLGFAGKGLMDIMSTKSWLRSLMPGATDADRAAMTETARRAHSDGIPLRIDEVAEATVPSKATDVTAAVNTASQVPRGSAELARSVAARKGTVENAFRGLADDLGTGLNIGESTLIGKRALNAAKKSFDDIAAPRFAAARNTRLPDDYIEGLPKFVQQEIGGVLRNDVLENMTGKFAPNSVGMMDQVAKNFGTKASKSFDSGDDVMGAANRKVADDIENFLISVDPDYAAGRTIARAGRQAVTDPLDKSALGAMSRGATPGNTTAGLLSASTPNDAGVAREAIKRIEEVHSGAGRQMMAGRLGDVAGMPPSQIHDAVLPSKFSADLAEDMVGPTKWTRIGNVLKSAKAINNKGEEPLGSLNAGGVFSQIYQDVMGFNQGMRMRALTDPRNIGLLGVVGPAQRGVMGLGGVTGAATTDSKFR